MEQKVKEKEKDLVSNSDNNEDSGGFLRTKRKRKNTVKVTRGSNRPQKVKVMG